ncbi:hypothetical protein BN1708_007311 [Verticillium longisporum]|uniref:CFEM domain-containing protein n=2 Tax=Verticillium longisporum TaxID=100787 RepID=A0A0G4MSB4_VERLO|nr:GPI-anchored CFEM domain protein like [Verticillium longisporum]CRK37057.1 hypothetical protein BN1708_007311 [Verticillium longisporum]
MRSHTATVLAGLVLLAALASGQDLASLPPCGQTCVNSVIASGLSCDSGDTKCLCANDNFKFGLNDCGKQACDAAVAQQLVAYAESLCAAATPGQTTAATPAPETTPSPPPEQPLTSATATPSPSPTPESVTSSTTTQQQSPTPSTEEQTVEGAATTSSAATSTSSVSSASAITEAPTTLVQSSTLIVASPSAKTVISDSPTSSSEPPALPTSANGDDEKSSNASGVADNENESTEPAAASALSTTAKIGIAVGAGVGGLGILLAVFLILRRRPSKRALQISDPMPGSGRDYSGGIQYISEKNHSELEMNSRRYEDMVPRQTPRHMI